MRYQPVNLDRGGGGSTVHGPGWPRRAFPNSELWCAELVATGTPRVVFRLRTCSNLSAAC